MFRLITAVILVPTIVFAEVNFDGNGNKSNIKEQITNTEVPAINKTIKEWTVMVYLNAKNDLERFGIADMNEMETVGSNDNLNIVVEMGRIKGHDSSNGDWTGVKRFYITKDNDTYKINSEVVQDMGEVDMGDYKTLINFVKWAKEAYPAKKYALIIWNHGSGWKKRFNEEVTKGVSYDYQAGNYITTPELGLAMKEIGKIDVLDFDACLMQMVEVAYEIKDYVTYIVASEETEPGDGNDYIGFLQRVQAKPTMGPLELAKAIVDSYYKYYYKKNQGTTKSVIRAQELSGLLDAVNNFADALLQAGDKTVIKDALLSAQSFDINDNKDLYHFARLIKWESLNKNVHTKAQILIDFIRNKLVAHNKTTSGGYNFWTGTIRNYSNAYGIAIYIPSKSIAEGYTKLQWAKDSRWDEFLAWYIGEDASNTTKNTTPSTRSTWHDWLFGSYR